jgi:hypothetical protein
MMKKNFLISILLFIINLYHVKSTKRVEVIPFQIQSGPSMNDPFEAMMGEMISKHPLKLDDIISQEIKSEAASGGQRQRPTHAPKKTQKVTQTSVPGGTIVEVQEFYTNDHSEDDTDDQNSKSKDDDEKEDFGNEPFLFVNNRNKNLKPNNGENPFKIFSGNMRI